MKTNGLQRFICALMPVFCCFQAYTVQAQAPSIITQPANQSSAVGGTIQFTVSAAGGGTLAYQWQKNTTNLANGTFSGRATISGATTASVTLAGITTNDQANYTCRVTNTSGSVTSSIATLTVYVAPTITTQPVGKTNSPGANVSFIVVATGTAPLSYQWMENGNNIQFATLNVYSLNNVTASNTGTYSVSVSNPAGTVNSSNAPLVVEAPPVITGQPVGSTNLVGGTAALNVTATGDALTYHWKQSGASVPGATNAGYSITNIQTGAAGTYTVTVSNLSGSVTSTGTTVWVVAPLVISLQPASQTAGVSSNVSFSVIASDGSPPLYYQWFDSTNPVASATGPTLALNDVQLTDSGSYYVVITNGYTAVTSAVAILSVQNFAPNIITQPVGGNEAVGDNFTFMVTATGTSLSYQWQKNGTNTANATGRCLPLSNLGLGDAGHYTVIVTNPVGSVTSSVAVLSVMYAPPVITIQPVGASLFGGDSYTFNVTATGSAIAYQWQKDGKIVPGVNGSTLAFTNLGINDSGNYTVTITNPVGSVTSGAAILSVHYITNQPIGAFLLAGNNYTFSVGAQGTALIYQWQDNGFNIPDANSASLTLTNLTLDDTGDYTVIVSNYNGSETSSVAPLYVGYIPAIVQQPVSTTNAFGSTAIFSCTATGPVPMNYQWFQNASSLIDGTNAVLTLTNLQLTNAGGYQVVVGNAFGSITSSIAILHISPGIVTEPTNQIVMPGSSVAFNSLANGEPPLFYQWQLNGTNVADNIIYSGSLSGTLNLSAALTNTVGNYRVVVSNAYGSITSAIATLSFGFNAVSSFNYSGVVVCYIVPSEVTNLWVAINGGGGASANDEGAGGGGVGGYACAMISVTPLSILTLSVGSGGNGTNGGLSPIVAYSGGNGGTNVFGYLDPVYPGVGYGGGGGGASIIAMSDGGNIICGGGGGGGFSDWIAGGNGGSSLQIDFTNSQTTGGYIAGGGGGGGGGASGGAAGGAGGPYPPDGSGVGGFGYASGVSGIGANNYGGSGGGGAGGSFLPSNYLASAQEWVFSDPGNAGQNGSISVVANPIPFITQQPSSQVATAGSPVQINLAVLSPVPSFYQWFMNGDVIPNATNSILEFFAVTPQDAGNYFVVVTNAYASVTSSVVTLTVNIPPYVTSQPQDQTVLQRSSANFTVAATGTPSLGYQWYPQPSHKEGFAMLTR